MPVNALLAARGKSPRLVRAGSRTIIEENRLIRGRYLVSEMFEEAF
jgi:hypothetical protein